MFRSQASFWPAFDCVAPNPQLSKPGTALLLLFFAFKKYDCLHGSVKYCCLL